MLDRAFRAAAHMVCVAPWMAVPPALLRDHDLLSLPAALMPFSVVCTAARLALIGTSAVLREIRNEFGAMLWDDGTALAVVRHRVYRR